MARGTWDFTTAGGGYRGQRTASRELDRKRKVRKFPKKYLNRALQGAKYFFFKNTPTKTNMLRKMACALAVGTTMTGAFAQTNIQAAPNSSAYFQDGRGTVIRSEHGLCWRSAYWTPADAVPGCDGELVPPITKPIAPDIASPMAATAAPAAPIAPKRCDFAVTFGSDQSFVFDKAVLSTAAKKRIDQEVLAKLPSCAKIDVILITGHTDLLGADQYNQRLSEKRAERVAAYLKSKGATARIDTVGMGKMQPVKSCDVKLARAKLINCYAPNRRVTVEVRGLAQ